MKHGVLNFPFSETRRSSSSMYHNNIIPVYMPISKKTWFAKAGVKELEWSSRSPNLNSNKCLLDLAVFAVLNPLGCSCPLGDGSEFCEAALGNHGLSDH